MTIASMDNLVAGLDGGRRAPFFKTTSPGSSTGVYSSLWKAAGQPGAAATPPSGAGEVPTKDTAGAIHYVNPGGGESSYLAGMSGLANAPALIALYDRLVHTSGLSGTSVAAQSINSTAITRPDANGADVELWIECYTQTGSTARTATVTYTNQDGTGSRTGTASIPASMPAGRMVPVTLQAGDTGVRSVQDLTLSGTTGTVGDFGITLARKLADLMVPSSGSGLNLDPFDLGLPKITDGACLALMLFNSSSSTPPTIGSCVFAQN